MEARAGHLRRQLQRAWLVASLPLAGSQLMTVDWEGDPADAAFGILLGAVAGAALTIIALLLGLALRLPTRASSRVLLACRLAGATGVLLATAALAADASAPAGALGGADQRHPLLLHLGAFALAFALANLPRARREAEG